MTPSLLSQQLDEISAEVAELKKTKPEPLTDTLAHWLAAQYAAAARMASREAGDEAIPLNVLSGLTDHVATLRRGDYDTARLRLDHERFEWGRKEKTEAGLDAIAQDIKDTPGGREAYTAFKKAIGYEEDEKKETEKE